eukprot:4933550-Heterocapsa_arctica.AAC.1
MLDSGSSDFLVGGDNLSKKDRAACTSGGPSMVLATANGNVERNTRSSQLLPHTGSGAKVDAL